MEPCVYILKSLKTGRFYIGSTKDLDRRLKEHERGSSKYTKDQLPVKLVFYQKYTSLGEARKIEYRLKRGKNKDIIERIVKEGIIRMK